VRFSILQPFPELGNGCGQGSIDDGHSWPNGIKEVILGDHFALAPEQLKKHLERFQFEVHRFAAHAEFEPRFVEPAPAEGPNLSFTVAEIWRGCL
jgi:hypothetical protein